MEDASALGSELPNPRTAVAASTVKGSEVPVPDTPRHASSGPKGSKARLSRRLGYLLYLSKQRPLSFREQSNLSALASRASVEALVSAMQFEKTLSSNKRLAARAAGSLQTQVQVYRRPRKPKAPRRIGIGYRDKGTLPSTSATANRAVQDEVVRAFRTFAFLPEVRKLFEHLERSSLVPQAGEWALQVAARNALESYLIATVAAQSLCLREENIGPLGYVSTYVEQ